MSITSKSPPQRDDLSDLAAALPDWSSPQALADWFGVPVASVYRWNLHGTGPTPTRVGKHVRYARHNVLAWLAAQAANAGRPSA